MVGLPWGTYFSYVILKNEESSKIFTIFFLQRIKPNRKKKIFMQI